MICSKFFNELYTNGRILRIFENRHESIINKCKEIEEQILVQLPKVMWQIIEIKIATAILKQ